MYGDESVSSRIIEKKRKKKTTIKLNARNVKFNTAMPLNKKKQNSIQRALIFQNNGIGMFGKRECQENSLQ